MNKIKTFCKQELTGWKIWEVAWMLSAIAIIIALSIYWQESFMGIVSATTGVACVILTGKGKLSAYIVGLKCNILRRNNAQCTVLCTNAIYRFLYVGKKHGPDLI